MKIPKTGERYYRAHCEYISTQLANFSVIAKNEEEAIREAKKDFEKWNFDWMKSNGPEKKLINVWVEEA